MRKKTGRNVQKIGHTEQKIRCFREKWHKAVRTAEMKNTDM